ncbi:DoxX family protein [Aquibaculum arenosum]|uniref:DoxX family protein n=1 Tax=Aquibaculum arenosum TaxID=3032591 RepID=A0ABT5YMS4_9PROT|nr:DoxX family protein [Fodinicurvata sp. CAU 1616]MDF2096261.1 DoxX family protein [Fodinicurvata sp. CAU 1616]
MLPPTAPLGALLLRLTLGVAFVAHGLMKVFMFTIPGTVAYFESLGYPGLFAYLVILAEIGGGLLLILGVQVRLIALLLLPTMIGALLEHTGNGWVFSAEGGGWEYPVFWIAALLAQALIGPGAYALRIPALRPLEARGWA